MLAVNLLAAGREQVEQLGFVGKNGAGGAVLLIRHAPCKQVHELDVMKLLSGSQVRVPLSCQKRRGRLVVTTRTVTASSIKGR